MNKFQSKRKTFAELIDEKPLKTSTDGQKCMAVEDVIELLKLVRKSTKQEAALVAKTFNKPMCQEIDPKSITKLDNGSILANLTKHPKVTWDEVYCVNVLNKKGKEGWVYCNTISRARGFQEKAIANGLNSIVFKRQYYNPTTNAYSIKPLWIAQS